MSTLFPQGLDTFVNPSSVTPLDANSTDPRLRHSLQHDNLNDGMSAVQSKVGENFSNINISLDYIANLLLMTQTEHNQGVRRDIIGGVFPTSVIWYGDSLGTIKLIEKRYTYDSRKNITQVDLLLYDGTVSNILKRTITDVITLSGPFETSRTRAVV
jgi:hypothetical protein